MNTQRPEQIVQENADVFNNVVRGWIKATFYEEEMKGKQQDTRLGLIQTLDNKGNESHDYLKPKGVSEPETFTSRESHVLEEAPAPQEQINAKEDVPERKELGATPAQGTTPPEEPELPVEKASTTGVQKCKKIYLMIRFNPPSLRSRIVEVDMVETKEVVIPESAQVKKKKLIVILKVTSDGRNEAGGKGVMAAPRTVVRRSRRIRKRIMRAAKGV